MASGKHGHTIHVSGSTQGIELIDNPGVEDLKTAIVYQACADYLCTRPKRWKPSSGPSGSRSYARLTGKR